jgi:histidinol dehydrogenase
MQIVQWANLDTEQRRKTLTRPAMSNSAEITSIVSNIVNRIRTEGDSALREFTTKFDKVSDGDLRLSDAAIQAACERTSLELKAAIQHAYRNVATFHQAQKLTPLSLDTQAGVSCELHYQPINRVGLYVPGGSAPLVSTVLMLAIPAKIAECRKVILCSPPPIADEIIYAATLCGVSEIYTMGGAQAIAAMAYGTESVSKVDKIFGPGNSWVTEAKRQVSMDFRGAAIDMPAGPSEVLVIADDTANAAFVASDLLSQAEHGPDSQVVLVTPSVELANQVDSELEKQLAELSRADIARKALESSRSIICADLEEACAISNEYAPEHLIVQTVEPRALLGQLENAGSIFLGNWTPESVGDYASGTNHTLPTYGYAKTASSLGLADYQRRYTVQELSAEGLTGLATTVTTMADAEGLTAHKRAVTIRMDSINSQEAK